MQRAVIVLRAKQVEHSIEYIDLAHRPAWFLELSPTGKVPLLRVDDAVLFESQVIAEYLDETLGPRMHPADPLRRAQHRGWIELVSSALGLAYQLQVGTKDEDGARALADKLRATLQRTDGARGGAPYFDGESFSLVDAAIAPLLQRLTWIEEAVDLGIVSALPGVAQWRDALLAHDAVRGSTVEDIRALYRASWSGYLAGVRDGAA